MSRHPPRGGVPRRPKGAPPGRRRETGDGSGGGHRPVPGRRDVLPAVRLAPFLGSRPHDSLQCEERFAPPALPPDPAAPGSRGTIPAPTARARARARFSSRSTLPPAGRSTSAEWRRTGARRGSCLAFSADPCDREACRRTRHEPGPPRSRDSSARRLRPRRMRARSGRGPRPGAAWTASPRAGSTRGCAATRAPSPRRAALARVTEGRAAGARGAAEWRGEGVQGTAEARGAGDRGAAALRGPSPARSPRRPSTRSCCSTSTAC